MSTEYTILKAGPIELSIDESSNKFEISCGDHSTLDSTWLYTNSELTESDLCQLAENILAVASYWNSDLVEEFITKLAAKSDPENKPIIK